MSECIENCLINGGECEGMTDLQFKSFVLTQIYSWKDVLESATVSGDTNTIEKIENQIEMLEQMLKF